MASKQWLEIRKVAYNIWEQEGYPDGKDIDHWLQAEREIKLLALYRDFQKLRRSLNHLYPTIRYDDAFFWPEAVQRHHHTRGDDGAGTYSRSHTYYQQI